MYQQVIRELSLLKAEEEEDGRDDDENGDDDDDDDNDDNENAADHSTVMTSKFGRYSVPVNGYDEDEDCINVEDEEYLDYIRKNNTIANKTQQFLSGVPVDDEEEDDLCCTEWVLKDVDVKKFFFDSMQSTNARDPMFIQMLNNHLTQEDTNLLNHLGSS